MNKKWDIKMGNIVYHKTSPEVIGIVTFIDGGYYQVKFNSPVDLNRYNPGKDKSCEWNCVGSSLFPTRVEARMGKLFTNSMKFVRGD